MTRLLLLLALASHSLPAADLAQRVQELEGRLARAEGLIAALTEKLERAAAPPILEALPAASAPTAAPEVTRSETKVAAGTRQMPQELLPNLGQIGAATSFTSGIHSGLYGSGRGSFLSGAVELPLLRLPGGRLLYELSVGVSRSESRFTVTSNVAQVANLAFLGPSQISDAINGTGAAPFAVSLDAQSRLSLLQVTPFGLKYRSSALERYRLRPYAVLAFGAYVTISNQNTATGLRPNANLSPAQLALFDSLYGNGSPFGGALIGGQIAASKELVGRGIPSGQGGIDIGLQTGGGIEWRWKPRLSFGADFRWNRLGNGMSFYTIAPRGVLHF